MARHNVTHIGNRTRLNEVVAPEADDGPGPWTPARLALARRCTDKVDAILMDCGYTMQDIDIARWNALGRTNEEALQVLNGQGTGDANNVSRVAR